MRFGTIGPRRPEAFLRTFRIYRAKAQASDRGRIRREEHSEMVGEVKCILSVIKPDEQNRYSQMNVTVTHTIFHSGSPVARENDVLVLVKGDKETRYFRVQSIQNHGEMDIFTTYYCEERGDINGLFN